MDNIAIISAGVLPLPAVRGGAVESLIDFILNENEVENKVKITVFSIYNEDAEKLAKKYMFSSFEYIRINKRIEKLILIINKILNKLLKKKLNLNNLYIKKVCKIINGNDYDHIIIENRPDYVPFLSKLTKTKVSLHIHNDYLNEDLKKGRVILDDCFKVITVSKYISNRLLTLGDKYNNKAFVLKNCTDTNRFNKENYSNFRRSFRERNNICKNDIVIMFSGRIHPTKGIKELMIAFKNISYTNCKLLVVGSSWYGNNEKTAFMNEIEELSNDIKEKIIFTGFVPFSDMPMIHSVADIAVVPSIWEEPAGLVVIEAMSSGLPLLVTDAGGIPEYVDKESVIMIKRDTSLVENLTISMEELIADKHKRERMSYTARQHALQFNTKQYFREFIKILGDRNAN